MPGSKEFRQKASVLVDTLLLYIIILNWVLTAYIGNE